jgi:uncharacterized protein (DUF362 family)/Pyruvate/2-oxoacid:ferredoxin oxidoreductase delta subunit
MSKVAIVRCDNYEKELVYNAVEKSINLLGGIEKFVKKGEKVLIKPNLLSPKKPEKAVTTHPEIVRAIIKLVKKVGGIPYVGDSPGGAIIGSNESSRLLATIDKYWLESGLKKVCEEENAQLVSFETGGVEIFKIKNRKYTPEVYISKTVMSFDVIISVPKLKTHGMVLFTGAIKNLFGCVPGLRKANYHKQAIHPDNFSQLLVDIYSIVKPKLSIFDGVYGMDGNGPSAGRIKHIGVIISGEDAVAVDSVASKIIGFKNPNEIPTTKIAYKQHLGESDLTKIEILGDKLEDFVQKDFLKPSNAILKTVPQWLVNLMSKIIWSYPEIDETKCTICKMCLRSCPVGAIEMEGKYPKVNRKKCITCMCCHEVCNYYAINIRLSWLANKIIKR